MDPSARHGRPWLISDWIRDVGAGARPAPRSISGRCPPARRARPWIDPCSTSVKESVDTTNGTEQNHTHHQLCEVARWAWGACLPGWPPRRAAGRPDLEPSSGHGNTCFAVPASRWRAMYRHSRATERDHWATFAVSLCMAHACATDPPGSGRRIRAGRGPLVNEGVDFVPSPR